MSTSSDTTTGSWDELFSSKHNRKYWKNQITGAYSWTDPNKKSENTSSSTTKSLTKEKNTNATPVSKSQSKTDTRLNTPATKTFSVRSSASDNEWATGYSVKHAREFWKNNSTGKISWKDPNGAPNASTATATVTAPDETSATISALLSQKSENERRTSESSITIGLGADSEAMEWMECFSSKLKRKFWKNTRTGQATWKEPLVIQKQRIADEAEEQQQGYEGNVANNSYSIGSSGKPYATSTSATAASTATATATVTATTTTVDQQVRAVAESDSDTAATSTMQTRDRATSNSTANSSSSSNNSNSGLRWEERYHVKHGKPYWKQVGTGKTSWTDPMTTTPTTTMKNKDNKTDKNENSPSLSLLQTTVDKKGFSPSLATKISTGSTRSSPNCINGDNSTASSTSVMFPSMRPKPTAFKPAATATSPAAASLATATPAKGVTVEESSLGPGSRSASSPTMAVEEVTPGVTPGTPANILLSASSSPGPSANAAARSARAAGWVKRQSAKHNRSYWRHTETGQTTWLNPIDASSSSSPSPSPSSSPSLSSAYHAVNKNSRSIIDNSNKAVSNNRSDHDDDDTETRISVPTVGAADCVSDNSDNNSMRKVTPVVSPAVTSTATVVDVALVGGIAAHNSLRHSPPSWRHATHPAVSSGGETWATTRAEVVKEMEEEQEEEEEDSELALVNNNEKRNSPEEQPSHSSDSNPSQSTPVAPNNNKPVTSSSSSFTSSVSPPTYSSTNSTTTTTTRSSPFSPNDWDERYSEEHGRPFWHNNKTGRNRWSIPGGPLPETDDPSYQPPVRRPSVISPLTPTSISPVRPPSTGTAITTPITEWVQRYSTKHEKPYWKHAETGEMTWSSPVLKSPESSSSAARTTTTDKNLPPSPSEAARGNALLSTTTQQRQQEPQPQQQQSSVVNIAGSGAFGASSAPATPSEKEGGGVSSSYSSPSSSSPSAGAAAAAVVPTTPTVTTAASISSTPLLPPRRRSSSTRSPSAPSASSSSSSSSTVPMFSSSTTTSSSTSSTSGMWMEFHSAKHDRPYWKNKMTGEASWKNPQDVSDSISDGGIRSRSNGGFKRSKSVTIASSPVQIVEMDVNASSSSSSSASSSSSSMILDSTAHRSSRSSFVSSGGNGNRSGLDYKRSKSIASPSLPDREAPRKSIPKTGSADNMNGTGTSKNDSNNSKSNSGLGDSSSSSKRRRSVISGAGKGGDKYFPGSPVKELLLRRQGYVSVLRFGNGLESLGIGPVHSWYRRAVASAAAEAARIRLRAKEKEKAAAVASATRRRSLAKLGELPSVREVQ